MADSILVLYAAENPSDTPGVRTLLPTAEALQETVEESPQGAVLAIGGDAFAAPLPWREWVRALPRHRQGLGNAVRQALAEQGHPGAPLIAVDGAVEQGRIVLVAPDDAAVRDAALGLLAALSGADRLSVPVLDTESVLAVSPSEVIFDDDSDAPEVDADVPDAPARVSEIQATAPKPAVSAAPAPVQVPIWQQALDRQGWRLDRARWGQLPDELAQLAPVRQILASAGERRLVLGEDGQTRIACGFPDLRRTDAKVITIAIETDWEGRPVFEFLALHRHPRPTGTCTPAGAWTPASDLLSAPVCEERTGRKAPEGGDLFAVDGSVVYLRRGRTVVSWNGQEERAMGTPSQALASLVLRWSQR